MNELYLQKSSMITPLGATTEVTSASVAATISAYKFSPYFGRSRQAMIMANVPEEAVPGLTDTLQANGQLSARQKRMVQLAAAALIDIVEGQQDLRAIPLFIAGPEQSPYAESACNRQFIEALAAQSGLNFDKKNSQMFAMGRAAGFHAIDYAFKFLAAADAPFAIVGGVDTYKDTMLLAGLDAAGRILSRGADRGFAPGEAASFVLLGRVKEGDADMRVFPPGLAMEEGHIYSEKPYLGEGLDRAFKSALAGAVSSPIGKIYSSMNGEHYFAKEYGVAVTRNTAAFLSDYSVVHPADCFGDLGAAYGLVALALASRQKLGSYMIYGSSDGPYRGAICAQIM